MGAWSLASMYMEFFPGGQGIGKNGFVFTCKYGFIDLGHFFWMAADSYLFGYGKAYRDGVNMEMKQEHAYLRVRGDPKGRGNDMADSAYTVEDLESDRLGALFGQSLRRNGGSIAERMKQFLDDAGAVDFSSGDEINKALIDYASSWNGHNPNDWVQDEFRSYSADGALKKHLESSIRCKLCDGDKPKHR